MKIIRTVSEMAGFAADRRSKGIRIGLVPTMGYLHAGHLSLFNLLDGECDLKMASIFVNPIQFGKNEDLSRYPRNEKRDVELLESTGCEVIFVPEPEDIYPPAFQTYVEVENLQKPLCGPFRPEHFKGVATIVLKLFNVTGCRAAAFGLKDFQQAMIIRRMVSDLNLDIKILLGEIIREPDGLAMSSRNVYLSEAERRTAMAVPTSLRNCLSAFQTGECDANRLAKVVADTLEAVEGIRIEYIEIVDSETLLPVIEIESSARVALAVYVGRTRLIDNIELK